MSYRIVKQPAGFSEPFKRFPGLEDSTMMRLFYRDEDHIPDNKRPGQVDSVFTMKLDRNTKSQRVTIEFGEITTSDNGRVAMRTITTDLSKEDCLKLADFLRGVAENV